jgi:general L-amino acid transport system permease protein
MAALDNQEPPGSSAAAFVNDERVRSVFYQIVVFGLVAYSGWYLFSNTAANLVARGMNVGFDFLGSTAGFAIAWTLLEYDSQNTYLWVYVVGIANTLFVAFISIILTTMLGFVMGILRLSKNWLISNMTRWYVEILRNTPLLLQIIFWYLGVFQLLPRPKQSIDVFGLGIFELNNRGFYVPKGIPGDLFWMTIVALIVAVVAVVVLNRKAAQKQEETGKYIPTLLPTIGILFGLPLAVFFLTGMPLEFSIPELKGFNFRGGVSIPPAMCALLLALVIYHSAYVAEMVRAGILSVSHGQTEAAYSLGIKPSWTMRLVIIPQAMRAIIPPMISLWMNVVKNSSLAIAIGYPDLVAVFMQTSLNQSGHAIEIVAMVMLFYMTVSLTISGCLNVYNKKVQLRER